MPLVVELTPDRLPEKAEKVTAIIPTTDICEEYTREINQLRWEASSSIAAKKTELKIVKRQIPTMIEAIKDGLYRSSMKGEMNTLEDTKRQLMQDFAYAEAPPPLLHPNMAREYRNRTDDLFEAFKDEQTRFAASYDIRGLVGRIGRGGRCAAPISCPRRWSG